MNKITEILFELKRELEDTRDTFYELEYTELERKQGQSKCDKALLYVNNLLGLFMGECSEEELKCEQRTTMGHLNRCVYCSAYNNEKCRW